MKRKHVLMAVAYVILLITLPYGCSLQAHYMHKFDKWLETQ